jgi:hypothetical protein
MNPFEYNGNLLNLYLMSLVPLRVSMQIRIDPETALDEKVGRDLLFDIYDFVAEGRYVRIEIPWFKEYKEKAVYVRLTKPFFRLYDYDDALSPSIFSVLLNLS